MAALRPIFLKIGAQMLFPPAACEGRQLPLSVRWQRGRRLWSQSMRRQAVGDAM